MLTVTLPMPSMPSSAVLHHDGHLARHRAARRGQRHVHRDVVVVGHVHLVDKPEFVDVHRDFRVVNGLQRGHELAR